MLYKARNTEQQEKKLQNSRKIRHRSSQGSIPHSASAFLESLRFLAGFLKPSHLQKPLFPQHMGYSLFIRIPTSTIAFPVSEELNCHDDEQQESNCCLRWAVLKAHRFAYLFSQYGHLLIQRKICKDNPTALKCHVRGWPVCLNFISFSPWWVREAGKVHVLLSKK